MPPIRLPAPTEEGEQMAVMDWVFHNETRYPPLEWLFHPANGEERPSKTYTNKHGETRRFSWVGLKLKKMGLRPGVADLILLWPSGGYHFLVIEMKRPGETRTPDQEAFAAHVRDAGGFAALCWSADEAIRTLEGYLNLQRGEVFSHKP